MKGGEKLMAKSWLEKSLKKIKLNESKISTILGMAVVVVIALLLFNYFKGLKNTSEEITPETSEQISQEGETTELRESEYLVQKGDNLWKIAEKTYKSGYRWIDIAKENKIKSPYEIEVGEKLSLPQLNNDQLATATDQKEKQTSPIESDSYTVQKGDCLWQIAVRAYQDGYQWVKIAKANNLVNPDLIHSGNSLTIPR